MGLPSGRVTFAFVDVVGSTRALAEHGDEYAVALRAMHETVGRIVGEYGGHVVGTEGDSAFLAFQEAESAVNALCALQAELEGEREGLRLRVRAGAHTGAAIPVGREYVALAVHVAARVSAAANAGQVLVSGAVVQELPSPAARALGRFELRDVAEPVDLWLVAGDDTPPRARPELRTNAESPHSSFVGRTGELRRLQERLAQPGLTTLVGPGGVGKTRLVTELCLVAQHMLEGGAWLVELAGLQRDDDVASAIGAVLGVVGAADADALAAEARHRGDMLLVLDNCEHLLDGVADLLPGLLKAGRLRVVCTSRETVGVPGEAVVKLTPLATGTDLVAGTAEQLFMQRAEDAGAALDPTVLPTIRRICEQLDGLPLGLELAAARAGSMPAEELAESLTSSLAPLRRRGGEERQRSLDLLVEWSLRLLPVGYRDALLVLSVLPGRFEASVARSFTRHLELPDDSPAVLVERSLLDLDGERYRMLMTVRDVCRRERIARPELDLAAHEALFAWARGVADGVRGHTAAGELGSDVMLAFEEALEWALPREVGELAQLMYALRSRALAFTLTPRTRAIAERVLAAPMADDEDGMLLQIYARDVVTNSSGWDSVDPDLVLALLDRAEQVGSPVLRHTARAHAAATFDRQGQHERAREIRGPLLEADEPRFQALAWLDQGVSFHLEQDLPKAEPYYEGAVVRAEACGDVHYQHLSELNLALVRLDMGRFADITDRLPQVIRATAGRPRLHAMGLGLLARARLALDPASPEAMALALEAEAALTPVVRQYPLMQADLDDVLEAMRAAQPQPASTSEAKSLAK